MADLKVNIGGLLLKNPVMTASGTFGYGEEFADFVGILNRRLRRHGRENRCIGQDSGN